jgi:hypothetical protein
MKPNALLAIGLAVAVAGCGKAATADSSGAGVGTRTGAPPTAPTKPADPLGGVWRQAFTCPEMVSTVQRAHVPRTAFNTWAAAIPDAWGGPHQAPTGNLCRHAPKTFERVAKFRNGTVTLFDPPNLTLGLDASYTLVNGHTFTANDGGQNIPGTYTFTFTIIGNRLTVRVHEKDPFFIAAWDVAPFIRTS